MKHALRGKPRRLRVVSPLTVRMHQLGLTGETFAERVGSTPGTVSLVAGGYQLPTFAKWPRWALALQVSLADLEALFQELIDRHRLQGWTSQGAGPVRVVVEPGRKTAAGIARRGRKRMEERALRAAELTGRLADLEARITATRAELEELATERADYDQALAALDQMAPAPPLVVAAAPAVATRPRRRPVADELDADARKLLNALRAGKRAA